MGATVDAKGMRRFRLRRLETVNCLVINVSSFVAREGA
jgi:hypothetical protein